MRVRVVVRSSVTILFTGVLAILRGTSAAGQEPEVPILLTLNTEQLCWSCSFTPDGQRLFVAGESEAIQSWDLKERKAVSLRGHDRGLALVRVAPDGKLFASAGEDTHVVVWNVGESQEEFSLKKHTKRVEGLDFSPDGKTLVSGARDFMVLIWSLQTRQVVASLEGFGPISYLRYAPDGKTIALGTEDGRVGIWDTEEPRKVLHMPLRHAGRISRLDYSPDSKTLVSTDGNTTLILWDVRTGGVLRERKEVGAESIAYSPGGDTLAVGYRDGTIRLWDADGRAEKGTLKGHQGAVLMLTFSRDGKSMASASMDRTVRIWNTTGLNKRASK